MKLINTILISLLFISLASAQVINNPISGFQMDLTEVFDSIAVHRSEIDAGSTDEQNLSITGKDITIENGNTISLPKDTFTHFYSTRQHLLLNTWLGFNNQYGANHHQTQQALGTGANPFIQHQRNGYQVPFDSQLLYIKANGYHNNAEAMNIEVDITCFSTTDNSTTTAIKWRVKHTYTTNNTNARIFQWNINRAVEEGDEIIISMRKTSGSGTRRYYYYNANMYFEKN